MLPEMQRLKIKTKKLSSPERLWSCTLFTLISFSEFVWCRPRNELSVDFIPTPADDIITRIYFSIAAPYPTNQWIGQELI